MKLWLEIVYSLIVISNLILLLHIYQWAKLMDWDNADEITKTQ